MRTKKRTPDYGAISRRSIQNDFKRVQRYPKREKRPQIENQPEINAERRVLFVSENSAYYRYRSFFVGKLVRLIKQSNVGGWICLRRRPESDKSCRRMVGYEKRIFVGWCKI